MKYNSTKCTFGVSSSNFLGHIVSQRGIKANPGQVKALLGITEPKTARKTQVLTGRIAALNRYISQMSDKCKSFFKLMKFAKNRVWEAEQFEALEQLKSYLVLPPMFSPPKFGKELYLYLTVSYISVSAVLLREEDGIQSISFSPAKFCQIWKHDIPLQKNCS